MALPIYTGPRDVEPPPPQVNAGRAYDVTLILPPDIGLSSVLRCHKFPPQGPALLAAMVAPDNVRMRVVDLDLSSFHQPTSVDIALCDDDARVAAHVSGKVDPALEQLGEELVGRLDPASTDAFAFSLDRNPQMGVTAVIAFELKRRFGKPIILGGMCGDFPRNYLLRAGARCVDIATVANTPNAIRAAFSALRDMPDGRKEPPVDIRLDGSDLHLDDWPVPDFSIFRLDDYRRDPYLVDGARYPGYQPAGGPRQLVLGYNFVFNCMYACSFCTVARTEQVSRSPEKVVRDLAAMAERFDTLDFAFMDTQCNLEAPALSQALIDAKLGVRWSDSYRCAPSAPGIIEQLARSGCVGLTVGVESASDKVLKRMVKGYSSKDATRVVREIHEAQIYLRVNLLPCFPGERREDFLETKTWLEQHAFAIDDLSASSFYLLRQAQVAGNAERWGVKLREERVLSPEMRVRKNDGALGYDEVDGMTWEEREPTLEAYEIELREAYQKERFRQGDGIQHIVTISHGNALHRMFPTKAAAYEALNRWAGVPAGPATRDPRGAPGKQPDPPPTGTARPLRLTAPAAPSSALQQLFDAAAPAVQRAIGGSIGSDVEAHAILFAGGDLLAFQGEVTRDGDGAPKTVRIDNVLLQSFERTRRPAYRRLRPGPTLEVHADALRGADNGRPWSESLKLGADYHVVSFGAG